MSTTIADRAPMRSTGTPTYTHIGLIRRAQALVAEGWTRQELSLQTRLSTAALKALIHGRPLPRGTQPDPLVVLYESTPPRPHASYDHESARRYAHSQGWLTREWWPGDTIDQPDAPPSRSRDQLVCLIEDIEWLLATGETLPGVCRRLDLSQAALYRRLSRGHRLDVWARIHHTQQVAA